MRPNLLFLTCAGIGITSEGPALSFLATKNEVQALDTSSPTEDNHHKVSDLISRAKQLTRSGTVDDQHQVLAKLADVIARSRSADADLLTKDQLAAAVENTKSEIERLEQSDELSKLQDVAARAKLAHSSEVPLEPMDEAAALMHRVRKKGNETGSDDLRQSLALGARIEKMNALAARIKDVEARAAALESQAAASNRGEEDIKEADEALVSLRNVLDESAELEQTEGEDALSSSDESQSFAPTDLEEESANILAADLGEANSDEAAENKEAQTVTSGDNPADLLSVVSTHDSPEQSTLETTIQAIRSAATDPRDATEKMLELMRSEGDKLEALSDKASALQTEKDELMSEAAQILSSADTSVHEADQDADAANEYNADVQMRLEQLEDHASAGEEGLGSTPFGRDLKQLMRTSEDVSRKAEYEGRTSQNLAETAEGLSARVAEMVPEVEDQTQMMEEYISNIKMIAQAALDEASQAENSDDLVKRVGSLRDQIISGADSYRSVIEAMEKDIPRETDLGSKLRVLADETKKEADGTKKEAGCEEAHEAGNERRFAQATGESMKHVPHDCEEGVCDEEDPCEHKDCPSVSPVLPKLHETDPCDEALKDAKTRLGMRAAISFLGIREGGNDFLK